MSANPKGWELLDVSEEETRQETCLDFEDTPVADAVAEYWMSNLLCQPSFERSEDLLSPRLSERYGCASVDEEVIRSNRASVDHLQNRGVREDGAHFLHEIEREPRTAETRSMIETKKRVEPDVGNSDRELLGKERIAKGEERVDAIGRWPTIASLEVERFEPTITAFQHPGEALEVRTSSCTLYAEQRLRRFRAFGLLRELLEVAEDDIVGARVVSAEQRS